VDEIDSPPPQQRTFNSQLYFTFLHSPIMSDAEPSALVGSKRPRDDGEELSNGNAIGDISRLVVPEMPSAELDDSDDEIGPMPDAPSVEVSKGRRKKRAVLSHERVYLENIPDTDRYTKSFMHRADINFVTMTK
jgi:peptidylprolyl isomerase domain and WD repeat-containing protein 1